MTKTSKLPRLSILQDDEFRHFIDHHKISGIGILDSHLLGSAYKHKMALYTADKKLERLAKAIL